MMRHSFSSSGPGFDRIDAGISSLPMSCSSPPVRAPRALVGEPHLVADGDGQPCDARRVPARVALVQLQDRHQPFERLLRRVLCFGERRRHRGAPGAQPILQRVVQSLLGQGGVVPAASEGQRLLSRRSSNGFRR